MLLIANIILFFLVELKIFTLVIIFQVLTTITIKQYFEKNKQEKKDQKNLSNNASVDKEIISSLFDQFSSSVFILNQDFTIHNQNLESKKIYNTNLNKDITSVIRDYDFISQLEKFKKNNKYNVFDWNKPLPNNQFFRTEIFTFLNFYILNIVETTFEKNKQEDHNEGLTSLTHELKTPLSVIIGYLETIDLENLPNKENQKY